jgi:hypothetical protein
LHEISIKLEKAKKELSAALFSNQEILIGKEAAETKVNKAEKEKVLHLAQTENLNTEMEKLKIEFEAASKSIHTLEKGKT